jgi:beta-glucanase (GH16 family)
VGWAVQAYNISPRIARGPYGKSAELENVVLNPLPTRNDWTGEGILGGAPGLQLWVRSQQDLLAVAGDQMVRVGEIDSMRQDMRYGSFRVGMKMSDIPGTCAAFFWVIAYLDRKRAVANLVQYRNDSQEIDLEYLSRQANDGLGNGKTPINLVIQSPASADANYNAINTSTFRVQPLPFQPSTGYHEYRFDWTPERIVFFADGKPLQEFANTFDGDSPGAPGTLMVNHWSTGNDGWSGGPPTQDAVLTLSYVKAYFNSSNITREAQWHDACAGSMGWRNRTCQIPDFATAQGIDPQGNSSEDSGKSFFFMYKKNWNVNQTIYPASTAKRGETSGACSLVMMPRIWMILGWAAVFVLFFFGG